MKSHAHKVMGSLAKSVDFRGCMPRSTFRRFYLIWQSVAIMSTWLFAPKANDIYIYLKLYCVYAIAPIPLFAAGLRRLQDTGQAGQHILAPLYPYGSNPNEVPT